MSSDDGSVFDVSSSKYCGFAGDIEIDEVEIKLNFNLLLLGNK